MDFRIFAAVMSVAVVGSAFGGFSKEKFRNPENIYSPVYFWMWNAKLDAAQLNTQVDDMLAHGMRSLCIHPFPKNFRPGAFDTEMSPIT